MRVSATIFLLIIALTACGRAGEIRPAAGEPLPVKPKTAANTPSPEDLLELPSIAKPARVDELLKRSEPRRPDRFDLPPPDGGAAPPAPAEPEPSTLSTDTGSPQ